MPNNKLLKQMKEHDRGAIYISMVGGTIMSLLFVSPLPMAVPMLMAGAYWDRYRKFEENKY